MSTNGSVAEHASIVYRIAGIFSRGVYCAQRAQFANFEISKFINH